MNSITEMISNHTLSENIFAWVSAYFMFIYFPMRLLTSVFLSKKFQQYLNIPIYGSALGNVAAASVVSTGQYINHIKIKLSPSIYKKEMPTWLKRIGVFIFIMDTTLCSCLFAGALGLFDGVLYM